MAEYPNVIDGGPVSSHAIAKQRIGRDRDVYLLPARPAARPLAGFCVRGDDAARGRAMIHTVRRRAHGVVWLSRRGTPELSRTSPVAERRRLSQVVKDMEARLPKRKTRW